ncbi:hypothetical protein [Klebsiella michiganensis]|uniref:hypothetical protein n=1 Tax=Klebsiella michiganensis TaxID=1134687 RepID=UPI001669629C|nr:hypothetical protein [Klebsiella michiganensis]MBD0920232.1 hypothetical protein [Klebsiella michiganensis]MBD0955599.1 hypothetical protein [Klebsiella michiganensis]MDS7746279.1 hypothetical protein [Klebsiella michiganensis]MDV1252498.1 hypothetical protein [Klebsiella michiganensis]QTH52894.1 hypothetical protein J5O09_08265 [Klebsiella michiganensis]
MALPERKYYTLQKAGIELGCEVDDLIHYAAIGLLQLCVKFPENGFCCFILNEETGEEEEVSSPGLNILSEYDFECESNVATAFDYVQGVYLSDYIRVVESFNKKTDRKVDHKLEGFLALKQRDVYENEIELLISEDAVISVFEFEVPRSKVFEKTEGYILMGFEVRDYESVDLKLTDLLITKDEIELLKSGGKKLETNTGINGIYNYEESFNQEEIIEHKVNANKIGDFISVLIRSVPELGDKVMRTSVHDRHKRIVDFFDKKHAKGEFIDVAPPSSATLEKYFKI